MMAFELEFTSYLEDISVALVPWDADTLGFPVYELRVDQMTEETAEVIARWLKEPELMQRCLVFSKVRQERVPELQALASNAFYPVETALELNADLSAVAQHERVAGGLPVRLRRATESDLAVLKSIAGSAFWADRFHLDPNIPDAAADARYVRWLERAYDEGETLFAYERTDEDAVIGFYLVRPICESSVDLNLVALDPAVAGRGFGRGLYELVARECHAMGFSEARTRIVAHNLPALNILTALGFSVRSATVSMHRFSSGSAPL